MNMHTVKLLWLWCLLATSWGGEVRLSTRQEIRDHLLSTARAAANNYADIRDELVVRERREREDTITETVQLLRADGTRSFGERGIDISIAVNVLYIRFSDFGDTAVGYQVVVQHNGSLTLADSDEVLVARTGEEFHIDDEIFEQVFPGFDQGKIFSRHFLSCSQIFSSSSVCCQRKYLMFADLLLVWPLQQMTRSWGRG